MSIKNVLSEKNPLTTNLIPATPTCFVHYHTEYFELYSGKQCQHTVSVN